MTLDQDQQDAAYSPAKNIIVVAGAGAGKSSVLIGRIQCLLAHQYNPTKIVAISYTNAAAGILRERLAALGLPQIWTGTIHAYVLSLLRLHGSLIGLSGPLTVLTETQTDLLLTEVQADLGSKAAKVAVSRIQASIKEEAVLGGENLDLVRRINFEFYYRMRRDGMLSYDAILHFGGHLIAKLAASGEPVAQALLVDEYQDASPLVHKICTTLPVKSRFIVGDSDQAIFSFCGGSPAGMMELWRDPAWTRFTLARNYRSTPEICASADRLISRNRMRIDKKMVAVNESTAPGVVVEIFETQQAEQAKIVSMVKVIPPDQKLAVLCRTNFQVAAYAEALTAAGVPVRRRKLLEYPPDWEGLKQFVAFLGNPDNDWLAYQFLAATRSTTEATFLRSRAQAELTTINAISTFFAADMEPAAVINLASRHFSVQAVELLQRLTNGRQMSLAELGTALGAPDVIGEEIGSGVTVRTQHAAKGSEHDAVFIPGCQAPGSEQSAAEIEEERRLLFVAVTRARRYCYLSAARFGRLGPWQRQPGEITISPMLEEL